MKILLTGATGFVGSHLLSAFHQWGWRLISLVRPGKTVPVGAVVEADFSYPIKRLTADQIGPVDSVVHSGADTRVAKSIADPDPFIRHNILGTYHMLEYCRNFQPDLKRFVYLSTDEVYGPVVEGAAHSENAPHYPGSPYAASKAAAEDLCYAWNRSMGVHCLIVNTMNVIGEHQDASKFIPLIIRKLLRDETITVHGTPDEMGVRRYLYAQDLAGALEILMRKGCRGRYHIAGTEEITNVDLVHRIAKILGKEPKIEYLPLQFCRPGHEKRYALDTTKIQALGWNPTPLDQVLERIVHSGGRGITGCV